MKLKIINTGFPKINLAFILIIIIVIGNVVFNYYTIRKTRKSVAEMTRMINPYLEALADLNLMVTESKMYATNWVYLQNSVEDKEKLRDLQQRRFKNLRARLLTLAQARGNKVDEVSL